MSKAYRDLPFSQRFHKMGDDAESVFDRALPLGSATQFGFRRPQGIKFGTIPETFRHAPDRLTSTYLVEVVGLGRDGILKSIKVTKYEALKFWNKVAKDGGLLGVVIFVWNSHTKQFAVLSWDSLVKEVAYSKKTDGVAQFESDGVEYYPIKWERIVKASQVIGSFEE